MDENEVKQERNIHIQSRLKLSQKKEQKENVPMVHTDFPGVNAGIGKLRNFTVPQGIKVLEAHYKLKGLDAAQITDIVFKER